MTIRALGDGRYLVVCPYALDALDVPSLGPYDNYQTACDARDSIVVAVASNSE